MRTFPAYVPDALAACIRARALVSAMFYQDPLLAYLPDGKLRKRRRKRTDLNEALTPADPWQRQYLVYQDWRDNSSTLQRIRSNAARFQQTCESVKRGLQQAQSQIVDQVDSSRDAVVVALKQQLKSAKSKLRRALEQQQQQQKVSEELGADLAACSRCVKGSKQDSQSFALGSLAFGALAFVCGSAPWLLPCLYLAFAAIALPWRIHQFYCKRLTFFLLDFCYVSPVSSPAMGILTKWYVLAAPLSCYCCTCSGQTWQQLLTCSLAVAILTSEQWCMHLLMVLWQEPCLCGRAHGSLVQLLIVSGDSSNHASTCATQP